ncbi:MAG: type II toxin-antitoxin system VapC family toxin [Planctomycetota bacterium]
MNVLLDTHFLLWLLLGSDRVREFPWLDRYRPWRVSPVSFLEIAFLGEAGRIEVRTPELMEAVSRDPRFHVDEPPLVSLVRHAVAHTWTRDPFDRLLVAHSVARRIPFCSVDRVVKENHRSLPRELS